MLISAGLFAAGSKEAAALKTAYDGKDAKAVMSSDLSFEGKGIKGAKETRRFESKV